jgi:5-methylcytosine-specific restriction endonuclease McrA
VFAREPLCRECLKENKVKVAFAIDHIESISESSSEELKYGISNLQPLCYFHHRQKTSDDYHEKLRAEKKLKGKLLQDSFDDW